jgi:hypothetical protein
MRAGCDSHPDSSYSRSFRQLQFRISPSTILVLSRLWSFVSPLLAIPANLVRFRFRFSFDSPLSLLLL